MQKASDWEITLRNNGGIRMSVVSLNPAHSQVLIRPKGGITSYYGLGLLYEVTETATNSYQRYYHYDYRGSTVALTDGAGNVTDRVEYSPYATTTYRTGTNDTPFLFNGRYGVQTDPNGLLYMRARYYNPYICRFINPDPIGFSGGLNWYAYADGNPVSYLDPFGLCAVGETGGGSWLRTGATIGVGSVPWVGTLQSIVELISGRDYITGEETSRFWAAVGVVAGIVPGGKGALKALTKVDDVVDLAKPVGKEVKLLGTARDNLVNAAQDPRLRDAIDNLYRQGAKVGSGSSMDAYRFEQTTGQLLSPAGHGQKLLDRRAQLQELLHDPTLSPSDKLITKKLLIDIQKALGGN